MNDKEKRKFSLGDIIRKINETPSPGEHQTSGNSSSPPTRAEPAARKPINETLGINKTDRSPDTASDHSDSTATPVLQSPPREPLTQPSSHTPFKLSGTAISEQKPSGVPHQQLPADEDSDFDIMRYVGILFRRKNVIIIALVLAALFSVNTFFHAVKMYTANSRMLFSPGYQDIMGTSQANYQAINSREEKMNTHLALLKSQTLARRVSENLNRAINPALISGKLSVKRGTTEGEKNDIIDISFTHSNAEMARDVVNELCKAYVEYIKDVRIQDITVLIAKLQSQIAKKESELDQKETALKIFKESNRTVQLSSEANLTISKLSQIETARQQTHVDMLENKQKYLGLKNEIDQQQVDIIQSFTYQNPYQSRLAELELQLSTLTAEYSPEHFKVRMAKAEIDKIKETMESDIVKEASSKTFVKNPIRQTLLQEFIAATIEKSVLDAKRSAQEIIAKELDGELRKLPEVELQFAQLTRETESLLQVLKLLKTRYEEAKIKQDSQESDLKILEWAQTPTFAVSSVKKTKIFIILFIGLLIGIALAFLIEFLDQSLKDPSEIERVLEVPLLGIVPAIETEKAIIESSRDHGKTILEPFRALRATIKHIAENRKIKSIIISSAVKGEGKTTFAANIAITFAIDGKKVILIDGDMRRAQMHSLFHLPKKLGLCDYLSGSAEVSEILKPTVHPNLFVVTAGEHPQNPAELAGSYRFNTLNMELRALADIIIFDSPALLPVSDVLSMAPKIDACIMVVRALWTPSKAALQAKYQLQRIGCNIIGAILNGISLSRSYYPYYYGYYRYYAYKYSYEDSPDTKFSFRKFGLMLETKFKQAFLSLRPRIALNTISLLNFLRRLIRKKTFWILLAIGTILTIANIAHDHFGFQGTPQRTITFLGDSKKRNQKENVPAGTLPSKGFPLTSPEAKHRVAGFAQFDSVSATDSASGYPQDRSREKPALPILYDSITFWQKSFNEKDKIRFLSFYDATRFEYPNGNFATWQTASENILLHLSAPQSIIRLSDMREKLQGKSYILLNFTAECLSGKDTTMIKISTLWNKTNETWRIIREKHRL